MRNKFPIFDDFTVDFHTVEDPSIEIYIIVKPRMFDIVK